MSIEIVVNGLPERIAGNETLSELLERHEFDPENVTGVAIAVNEEVVSRTEWKSRKLEGGDTVEIVTARQGG